MLPATHETLDLDSRAVEICMRPQPGPGWPCDCSLWDASAEDHRPLEWILTQTSYGTVNALC